MGGPILPLEERVDIRIFFLKQAADFHPQSGNHSGREARVHFVDGYFLRRDAICIANRGVCFSIHGIGRIIYCLQS